MNGSKVWQENFRGVAAASMRSSIFFKPSLFFQMCSKCGASGANIGCVYRNCPNRCHYYCAKESGWSLEQETFISTCQVHKPRS